MARRSAVADADRGPGVAAARDRPLGVRRTAGAEEVPSLLPPCVCARLRPDHRARTCRAASARPPHRREVDPQLPSPRGPGRADAREVLSAPIELVTARATGRDAD